MFSTITGSWSIRQNNFPFQEAAQNCSVAAVWFEAILPMNSQSGISSLCDTVQTTVPAIS